MVVLMLLVSSLGVIYLGYRQDEQGDCIARYNERSARSQQARVDAAQRDRDALEVLVRSLVDENSSDGREQVGRYLRAIEENDRQRRENPIPPPPADLCS